MASETDPAVEAGLPTGGRSRNRRVNVMLVLLAVVTGWACWHVSQPWYSFNLRPGTEVTTSQGAAIPVSAHATVSAWQLVHPAPTAPAAAGASATAVQPAPPGSIGGVPTSAFLLAMMALLAIAGAKLPSALLSVGSLLCGWYSWIELTSLRSTVENPLAGGGGAFGLTRMPSQAYYSDGLLLAALLAVGLAGMVVIPKLVASAERANKLLSSLHEPGTLEALAHTTMAKFPMSALRDAATTRERESQPSS